MNRPVSLSRPLRLLLAAVMATPVAITLAASSPSQAALGGVTPFEIDSNTTVQGAAATDWVSKFASGDVAVSNDANFTGAAIVQTDVGTATTAPSWLPNCPPSNTDTVFKNSTSIADNNWVGDDELQSVTPKNDICQSYFSYDVVQSGARAGHIVSYVAFTRRVFNGDGSYYFLLTKGPNPDIRVAGDVVIEVDYGSQGDAQSLRIATWGGAGPTLGAYTNIGVANANVQLSPVQYFAEMAIDLTALGLAPNVYELPDADSCQAFGFGRVISRTGNSPQATLKDDGEPTSLDFDVCGEIVIQKVLTTAVPATTQFPVTITPPSGVTLDYPDPILAVPGGTTNGGTPVDGNADPSPDATPTGNPVVYGSVPPRLSDGYNVWESLTGDLAARWDLVGIVCVNDKGTTSTLDDVTTEIDSASDEFSVFTLESVTCTITNAPAPVLINVDKDADGQVGSWPVALTGAAAGSVDVTDDGTIDFTSGGTFETFGQLAAGSYTLTEGVEQAGGAFRPAGWSCAVVGGGTPTAAAGASIGVNANPGDVINCTITNTPVAPPSVEVIKSAAPTSFAETATPDGSPIVYTVEVRNTGSEPFTITNLTDLVELRDPAAVETSTFDLDAALVGSGGGIGGSSIVTTDCAALIGQTVAGGASRSCQFSVAYTGRDAGQVIYDLATVDVVDEFGRTDADDDDATVTVNDVPPVITVDKQNVAVNGSTAIVAPGGTATYSITITNGPNAIEPITLTAVTDTISTSGGGFAPTGIDYFTVGGPVVDTTCPDYVGTVLAVGGSVSCQVTIDTTQLGDLFQDDVLDNHVAVTAVDDDGTPVAGEDDAVRTVLGEPPAIGVFKTDAGEQISEPGEAVAYDITITNLGTTETLEITRIVDEVFFTPLGGARQSLGSVVIDANGVDGSSLNGISVVSTDCDLVLGAILQPNGGTTSCTITLDLDGNAGDLYDDLVTVTGVDPDGEEVSDENGADTPVIPTPPQISILKEADQASVPETGGTVVFTLTITNESGATDPMTITELSDSVFGSFFPTDTVTGVQSTTCYDLEGVVLAPGESTSCTITAVIQGEALGTHHNVATVTGHDDEGTPDSDSDEAAVDFTDVLPVIIVTKSADTASVDESGELVTFTVTIENSSSEPVTTTTLSDSVYGNLVGLPGSTCVAGVALAATDGVAGSGADFYQCTFVQNVAQIDAELSHHDVVTGTVQDDEGNTAEDDDDETITFDLVPPTVVIEKSDGDATVAEPGGDVTYTVEITNTSFETVTVTALTDTITYADPASEIVVDLLAPTEPVSDVACADAGSQLVDITTYAFAPGETVTCTFVVALAGTSQIVRDVADVVVVDNDAQTGDDEDDESTPILDVRPAVDIVKTANPTEINVGDTVTYTFVITNASVVEELTLLTLVDDKFGDIFAECVADGMVTALAPGAATDCAIDRVLTELPGSTHVNNVVVTGADDETLANLGLPAEEQDPELVPVSADDDADVLTLAPATDLDKRIVGTATRDAAGLWTIVYEIVVSNTGAGRAVVDVDDELLFGDGVVIQSVAVTTDGAATLNPGFDGVSDQSIAAGVEIAGGSSEAPVTQTFTVTVTARIDTPVLAQGAGTCDPEGVEAGGFLNAATLTTNGEPGPRSFDCDPFSTLTLVKQLPNDDGGNATLADFTLSAAAGGATYVQGTGTVTAAVPAGVYTLAETSRPGYTTPGFVCSTLQTGFSVTVPVASDVTCRIVNDDQPVDLALTKDDAGFVARAGQQTPFPYTIKVSNVGDRELDDEPVTVVDDLPAAFEWVAPAPAGCVISGQRLTCNVAPATLRPAGTIVTITATARLKAGASAGTFDNRAHVTTQDDPVCVGNGCVPPPCSDTTAIAGNNNVDCEPTTVVPAPTADLAIVKTASQALVGAGGGFTWVLDVTNNGPDAATDVVVSDVVPNQVAVVGVSSAQFSCSQAGNTVTCTKPSMAVGETGQISIAVSVPLSATDGLVTNVGTVTGATPDPNTTNNSDDALVTLVAQQPPPTTTTTVPTVVVLPPTVNLPATGADSTKLLISTAIAALLLGGLVTLLSRRRRDVTTPTG